MKPLRTAMIGCGHFAKRHAGILASLHEIDLVAFCDSEEDRANTYNQQYAAGEGVVFSDHRSLFSGMDLDLVYICLPPYAHENEVELACQHGVHILIEKPIALSASVAQSMAEQVRASGVKCQVGFMYRFGEAARWLKQQMETSNSPSSAFMAGRYACNSLHSWWWRDRTKSGGQLIEQVIHILDMARYFLGEPKQVYSMQENLFHTDVESYTVEDASATTVRFHSGAMAVITATNGAIPNRWDYDWRIFLPGLTADFNDANHAIFHDTRQAWTSSFSVAAEKDLYLAETLDLIQAIREDRQPQVPIEEGVRSLCFALAATQSAQVNMPVDVVMVV